MADYDVVVLGAGPGGYVAAIRAAQLGKKVAVVELKYWGGVCLNVGCIPSKALLRNAEIAHIITAEKKVFGIEGDATMAFGPTHARSRVVADASAKGVHYLMKKNKIDEIDGWGVITSPTSLDVTLADTTRRTVTFDNLIIATGCGHPAGARDVAVGARRDLRGADPHRPAPRVDHHRRVGRHRRRVRLRHDELRRRRHHRRVPRPDGPDRGPGRVQGAAQAVQEARRQGPARPPRSSRSRTAATRSRSRSARRRAATSRCWRPTRCFRRSGSRRGSRATASSRPASQLTDRGAIAIDELGRTNVPNDLRDR